MDSTALCSGIHHVAMKVADLDRSLQFYCGTLGLEPVLSWGEGDGRAAMVSTGAGCLELFAGGEQKPAGQWMHVALAAPDCDAALRAARDAGAEVTMEPTDVTIPANEGDYPIRIAFCKGPDGEIVEFFQVKEAEG